ncbi:unnamed protein product [Mucor hiemalis]
MQSVLEYQKAIEAAIKIISKIQPLYLFQNTRAFTTLSIAVSLALTANARTIGKRETSPPVNECISLVNGLKVSFDFLNATFASYSDPSQEPALSKTKEEREKYFTDSLKLGNEIMAAQE